MKQKKDLVLHNLINRCFGEGSVFAEVQKQEEEKTIKEQIKKFPKDEQQKILGQILKANY